MEKSPSQLIDYIPRAIKLEAIEHELISWDRVLKEVQECIVQAQAPIKRLYDSNHAKREFQFGDYVYLKLQPYHQTFIALRKNFKLSTCYYGPFKVRERISKIVYHLKLYTTSRLHFVLHVLQFKKKIE